jgi:hypothetical protein
MTSKAGVIHIAALPRQQQIRNPDQCDKRACYGKGEPVDLFHCVPTASAHNSRTLSSAMEALDSSFNFRVEGI